MSFKKVFSKFKKPLLNICFNVISNQVADKLEASDNTPLKNVGEGILGLSAGYVQLLTDKDPNDKQQAKDFLQQHKNEHIKVGADALRLIAHQFNDRTKKEQALQAIYMVELMIAE